MSEQPSSNPPASPKKPRQAKQPSTKTTGGERQLKYIAKQRAAGYVQLSGLHVPAVLRPRIRAMVKAFVQKWEAENITF